MTTIARLVRFVLDRSTVVVYFGWVAAALAGCALIVALAIRPPALGWLGFAIVSAGLLGLGAVTPLAFERTRVSARPPAVAGDQELRLLVIADSRCSEIAVCDEIIARLAGAVAVHVVVPIRVSHLHFIADDESAEQREAAQSTRITVGLLQQRGVSTSGSVGTDKPLESMTDALASFAATQVLLVTPPEEESYWLERDLLAKARPLVDVPVTRVVVPSTPKMGPTAEPPGAERV